MIIGRYPIYRKTTGGSRLKLPVGAVRDHGIVNARPPLFESLRWYRRHQLAAGALFWLPTAFLYLVEHYGFGRALVVQAMYYGGVVAFELPSGWLSDRIGRVPTLRLVALWWLAAHLLFVVAPGTLGLAGVIAAQLALAAGYASLSGTDVTLHFDTLEALGQADEFNDREAASRRDLLLVTAATAVVGGAVGLIDLRLPFACSLVAAAIQLFVSSRLLEPTGGPDPARPQDARDGGDRPRSSRPAASALRSDLMATIGQLRQPALAWLGLYVVGQVVVVHLLADLIGPYLATVLGTVDTDLSRAALLSGMTAAVVALVGASTVLVWPKVARRIGLVAALLVAATIPVGLLVVMASFVSWLVVVFLAARGVQSAATAVLIPGVVGAHGPRALRATFLSLLSLCGRLAYGLALLMLSLTAGNDLSRGRGLAAVIGLVLLALVVAGSPALARGRMQLVHEHDHDHRAQTHEHFHWHGEQGDGHHDHRHQPDFVGGHSHRHDHQPVKHRHPHTADAHHHHHGPDRKRPR